MKDLDSMTHTVRSSGEPVNPDHAPEQNERQAVTSLESARDQLATDRGPNYWRSLEQLSETPGFQSMLEREFPRQAAEWSTNVDRRRFLQLGGASLGLAGLAACTKQPPEQIIPYVRQPEDVIPGKPLFFASAVSAQGFAAPILGESHMGRPTKVEGNPEHPASLGATDSFTQASIYNLYDPDRSQAIRHLGQVRTWDAFLTQASGLRSALVPLEGDGLAILARTVTSPTLVRLLDELREEMPKARIFIDEPAAGNGAAGIKMATGDRATLRYDFSKADVVVSVDSDFLNSGPNSVRYSKDFSRRRKAHDLEAARSMSRYYAVESMPTASGTAADHRLAVQPTRVSQFVLALAAQLGVAGASKPEMDERMTAWVEEVAADLQAHVGSSAVVIGDFQSADVHALGLAINDALSNVGQTVLFTESVDYEGESLGDLVATIEAGEVTTLVIMGANPVYSSTADIDFAAAMDTVPLRIHLGAYLDETGERCHWHIPESNPLESWGDLRSLDGTATPVQPLITPLYDSHTAIDLVAALAGHGGADPRDLVRETWRQGADASAFEKTWRRSLHDGYVPGTEAVAKVVSIDGSAAAAALAGASAGELELIFRPDPTIYDGRYANNGWLQETPKPITKLTWDNALLMSPATAKAKGLGNLLPGNEQRDRAPMVQLTVGERSLEVPVWVVPGLADDTMVLHIGYGRTLGGSVADGAGFDASLVRTAEAAWQVSDGVSISRTGNSYLLACTQDHHSMEGRAPVRSTNVPTWEAHPKSPLDIHLHVDPKKSAMDGGDFPYDSYQWAMSIDLSSCTGCNACLVACVSENNIPVIGKEEVRRGREMHWIRIDRYYQGEDPNDVEHIVSQPVPCMQCEQAPCEVVCPVAATVHSDEGLNDMVYNRCVGTRYCSNNCPYKVRRFNFLLYQDFDTPQLKLGRNPDVTVRSRGVMEKCTYCVQRINQARIDARSNRRKIETGEVVTACQQACPSESIIFGDQANEQSAVAKAKASSLDYSLLEELGTRPRTTYLGRLTNPNPQLWQRLYPDRPLVPERHHGGGHGHGHGGHGHGHGGHGHAGGHADSGHSDKGHAGDSH